MANKYPMHAQIKYACTIPYYAYTGNNNNSLHAAAVHFTTQYYRTCMGNAMENPEFKLIAVYCMSYNHYVL
jgi:hypothetical protein